MKKLFTTIGLSMMLAMVSLTPAQAATGDFTIYPSYMHGNSKSWILLDLEQGATITDYVTVENLTNEPQSLKLHVVEAEVQNGSFLLNEENEYQHLGNWTRLEEQMVKLQPNEKKKMPVHLSIPQNIDTQEYTATILASKTETNKQNINITTRIGVRMYVDVHEAQALGTNIFSSTAYTSTLFFIFSLMGVIGAALYNLIHYVENRKYAKTQA